MIVPGRRRTVDAVGVAESRQGASLSRALGRNRLAAVALVALDRTNP